MADEAGVLDPEFVEEPLEALGVRGHREGRTIRPVAAPETQLVDDHQAMAVGHLRDDALPQV